MYSQIQERYVRDWDDKHAYTVSQLPEDLLVTYKNHSTFLLCCNTRQFITDARSGLAKQQFGNEWAPSGR